MADPEYRRRAVSDLRGAAGAFGVLALLGGLEALIFWMGYIAVGGMLFILIPFFTLAFLFLLGRGLYYLAKSR